MRHVWLLLILSFTLLAAKSGEPCGDSRLSGNRYFGAMRASLKSNAVQVSDVERALRSEEPYDPLEFVTPEKHQIVAKSLFAELVRDPEVRAQWSQTQTLLAGLLGEEQTLAQIRGAAERATKDLLAPHVIHTFDGTNEPANLAFVHLPTGEDAFAHMRSQSQPVTEFAVTTAVGKEIFHLALPKPAAPRSVGWVFHWHRDQSGTLWLYLSASHRENPLKADLYVYKLKWGTTELIPVQTEGVHANPIFFRTYGHQVVLVTGNAKRFDVTGERATPISDQISWPAQSYVHDSDGNLIALVEEAPGRRIVFAATKNGIFDFDGSGPELRFRHLEETSWRDLSEEPHQTVQLLAHETEDGQLLLAHISRDKSGDGGVLTIYAPLKSGDNVLLRQTFPDLAAAPTLHWMKGPRGETLVGFMGNEHVFFADPFARTLNPIPLGPGFGNWFSSGAHTYFWLKSHGTVRIFEIFGEVKR